MPSHGATDLYTSGAGRLLSGDIVWDTDTFKVALIDTADYTADLTTDEFLADIPGAAIVATSDALTGMAATSNKATADPARFPATTGDVSEALVVYKDTGDPATSPLVCYIDTGTGLPITPSGRGIKVSFNNSTVFALDIGGQTDIQIFTATGTWSKPDGNFVTADVVCIGGGGGGGAGEAPSANTAEGGGGGSPGGYSAGTLPFALLGATETVTVGTGGPGGNATVWAAVGNNGTAGNPSSFSIMEALGGGGGQGGQGTSGGVPGRPGVGTAPVGTKYQGATGATNAVAATTPDRCGGGGGASENTGAAVSSAGGNNEDNVTGSGTAGTTGAPGTAGGPGGDYTPSPSYAFKRGGGGGGGGTKTSPGFNQVNGYIGGAGGIPGGGGGGGGGGYQGTSGGGGTGARGVVTIVSRGEA